MTGVLADFVLAGMVWTAATGGWCLTTVSLVGMEDGELAIA